MGTEPGTVHEVTGRSERATRKWLLKAPEKNGGNLAFILRETENFRKKDRKSENTEFRNDNKQLFKP